MLDSYALKYHSNFIYKSLKRRGYILDINIFNLQEYKRKKIHIKIENLRSKYNFLSHMIGKTKHTVHNRQYLKLQVCNIKDLLLLAIEKLKIIQKKIKYFLSSIPNIPHLTVPYGINDCHNKTIMYWGEVKQFNFDICDHLTIGNKIHGFDWNAASKMAGSRFVVLKGDMALLYRSLTQFMLDIHIKKHGYLETYVPYLVNKKSIYGTGQLPKFKEELFYVSTFNMLNNSYKYVLIPTAEVPLTNLFSNTIINENDLPIMLTAYSPCFRSESLSYGKDSKGLMRMHQFDKVEIFQIHSSDYSMQSLENITYHAEIILQLLKLPYRKILLCTGDMGFAACKTYDLEVWFPFEQKYKEVSSCSNMSDFQARRIQLKYLTKYAKKKFIHTINGSGLAIGRTLAAILENYQTSDGHVEIPSILSKHYMYGKKFI